MLTLLLFVLLGCSLSFSAVVEPTTNKVPSTNDNGAVKTITIVPQLHRVPGFKPNLSTTNLSADASSAASSPFGSSCCGWGGVFGWTSSGSGIATMSGLCINSQASLVPSTLDLNQCIGWDSANGQIGCPNTGISSTNFISSQSGCRVIGGPTNVNYVNGVNAPITTLDVACNGPSSNVLYVTVIDLDLCVGVDSNGRLSCY